MKPLASLAILLSILVFFSASAFSQVNESVWYNDKGNDSCLVAYSDQKNYSFAPTITAIILVENNCGKPIVADIGFYEKDFGSLELDKVEAKDVLSGKPDFVFPEKTADSFLFKKAYSGIKFSEGETQFKVFFKPKTLSGEFLVAVIDSFDPNNFSALDPWWDAESTPDAYTLALWHFNDNAGTTAVDSSSNGNDLALFPNAGIWDAVTKKFGASSISPNNTYYGTQANLFDTVPAVWSVGAWVAPTSLYNNAVGSSELWFYRCGGTGCGANKIYCYWLASNGFLRCFLETGGTTVNLDSTKVTWAQDEWHYVQLIYDGTNLNLRIDGVLEDQAASANLPNGDFSFGVGAGYALENKSLFRVDEMEVASVDRNITVPGTAPAAGDLNFTRIDGYDTNATPFFSYLHDGNLTIDFNVSNADNNRLKLDLNYSSSTVQGTGTQIFEDLNLTSLVCPSQKWDNNVSQCHLDWNISSLLVSDGNYYLLFDLNRSPYTDNFFKASGKTVGIANNPLLRIVVWDENKMTIILTASAKVDGTTYSPGVDGNILIPASSYSGEKIVSIGQDGNYGWRNYLFDFDSFPNNRDFNAVLLKDVNGQSIGFEFYSEDGLTKLTNEMVTVIKDMAVVPIPDNNIAGIARLSGGQTTFFLNPDANYVFKVNGTYYYSVLVSVQIPKTDSSLAPITPFSIGITGLASRYFTSLTATSVVFPVFPNTTSHYIFDINSVGYYQRKHNLNPKGNPHTYSLQPYLVSITDGVQAIFYTKKKSDLTSVSGILIRVFKAIPGAGTVEMQSIETDAAGTAALSFFVDQSYTLKFYRNGTYLFDETIVANFTTYYVYIDTEQITGAPTTQVTIESIRVSGFPNEGYIVFGATGYDINVLVDVNNGTIAKSWLTITDKDGNVSFNSACGAGCGYHLAKEDLNSTTFIRATIFVATASGMLLKKEWTFTPLTEDDFNFIANMKSTAFRTQFGCSADPNEPCFLLLFIAIFITIGVLVVAGTSVSSDLSALSIITIMVLGIFTYLTWIPTAYFILACLGAFGGFVFGRR